MKRRFKTQVSRHITVKTKELRRSSFLQNYREPKYPQRDFEMFSHLNKEAKFSK